MSHSHSTSWLLVAPLTLALSTSWGCSSSQTKPVTPANEPAQTASASVQADTRMETPAAPKPSEVAKQEATASSPRDSRVVRGALLGTQSDVVSRYGNVDKGDISDTTALPSVNQQHDVRRVFEDHDGVMQGCFRADRGRDVHGNVTVGFVIGADGKVVAIWPVSEDVGNAKVVQCLLQTTQGLKFNPTPGGTTQVTYTITHG